MQECFLVAQLCKTFSNEYWEDQCPIVFITPDKNMRPRTAGTNDLLIEILRVPNAGQVMSCNRNEIFWEREGYSAEAYWAEKPVSFCLYTDTGWRTFQVREGEAIGSALKRAGRDGQPVVIAVEIDFFDENHDPRHWKEWIYRLVNK